MPSQREQTWPTPGQMDLIAFLICIDVEVRGGLKMGIAQSDPCTFSVDKSPPEAPTARHRGTKHRRKRMANRCEIESTCTFSRN